MRKIKMFLFIVAFVIIFSINYQVYADDETEETTITWEEIEEIKEAAADIDEIPKINSRNAVIFDRSSRSSYIWKR